VSQGRFTPTTRGTAGMRPRVTSRADDYLRPPADQLSMPSTSGLARIGIVGPMVGRNPGFVTTQGEFLTDLLRKAGHSVMSASSASRPAARLVAIPAAVMRHRQHVDILIVETYGGRSFIIEDLASKLGRACGHRVIFHLHGGNLGRFMARHPAWASRVFQRADAFVAPSQFLARAVVSYAAPCWVIPNVLELAHYAFSPRTRPEGRLLWMRSFHPLYNPLMAIDVLARLRQRVPAARLVMAGQDKGEEAVVRTEAVRRGLAEAVAFPGFLDQPSKLRELARADMFITTNHIDNAPVAVLEAAAAGLPIVATDVGGVRDLLNDGETALLTPDGDASAMANALARLIEDSGLTTRLVHNGRRLAEQSSWEAVCPQWQRLFSDLAGRDVSRGAGR
jgi:L-malate glycosyltransferase